MRRGDSNSLVSRAAQVGGAEASETVSYVNNNKTCLGGKSVQ